MQSSRNTAVKGAKQHFAQKVGVCTRHGAKVKRCSTEECTNKVFDEGVGVCIRHGAKIIRCSTEGCTVNVVQKEVRIRHETE